MIISRQESVAAMVQRRTIVLMKTAGPHTFSLLLFLLAVCMPAGRAATMPDRTPKAIFIIVDGIPADVIERTPTPNLDEISGANGYARAYVGGAIGEPSESPTVSAVGYNSLLTGTWSYKHNVWTNTIIKPNYDFWDIFRIAKNYDPSLQTAIFSTWTDNRSRLLGDGLAAAGGRKLDYHFDGFELDTDRFPHDADNNYISAIDAIVADEAARFIGKNGPDLSWIYLEYTDDIGHRYGDSPEQIRAVGRMDERIGIVWKSVRKRQREHDEDWLLVVTTDHGRDGQTGRNHGGQSERERTTWIATNSKRLNAHFNETPGIVDILPSIATHLGLDMPDPIRGQLDGRSFID
jgi:predicted AlkP superfamily pyrophosphatase or phosphodiesterase